MDAGRRQAGYVEVSIEDLTGGVTPTYEFKAGGVVANPADDNSMDGTYTSHGNVVSISLGPNSFDLPLNGDSMTMEQDNLSYTLTISKS